MKHQNNLTQKRVALINDLSSFGKCSLGAALPIFATLNVEACPLPTAVLSCQTGFDGFFMHDLTNCWQQYMDSWRKLNITFDGVLSGFLTSETQAKAVYDFLTKFKTPNTLVVVDPVLGDGGKRFETIDDALMEEMKQLVSMADISTPNLTELCLLLGLDYATVAAEQDEKGFFDFLYEECNRLFNTGCKSVLVTGIKRNESIYNMVADRQGFSLTKSPYFGVNISGAGDIMSSIVTAKCVKGCDLADSVKTADKFLTKAVKSTVSGHFDRNHGINFESFLRTLK